jgi:hypothetical protein
MMRKPPGLLVTISSWPSLKTIVELIEDSGRLFGPGALASPPGWAAIQPVEELQPREDCQTHCPSSQGESESGQ